MSVHCPICDVPMLPIVYGVKNYASLERGWGTYVRIRCIKNPNHQAIWKYDFDAWVKGKNWVVPNSPYLRGRT